MDSPAWTRRIVARLAEAARLGVPAFGAERHGFRLRLPLPEAEVAAFEAEFGVVLPDEYRAFLLWAGDGGAGPGLGLLPLREAVTAERQTAPEGILATPFPRTVAHDPDGDDAELEPLWARHERGEITVAEIWLLESAGTLALSHDGCGYYHLLVVSGAARGQTWMDGRSSGAGLQPLGMGFRAWYERWLDGVMGSSA